MEQLSARDFQAISDQVRTLYAALDLRPLLDRIAASLHQVLRCDRAVCLHLELPTRRRLDEAQFPRDQERSESAAAVAYPIERHPLLERFLATGGDRVLTLPDAEPHTGAQVPPLTVGMTTADVPYLLATGVPAEPPGVVWLELHRSDRDFSERDRAVLAALRPHLAQAIENAQYFTRVLSSRRLLRQAGDELGVGLVDFRPTPCVRRLSRRAQQLLTQYFGTSANSANQVPPSLVDWVHQQESRPDAPGVPAQLMVDGEDGQLSVRFLPGPGRTLLLLEEVTEQPSITSTDLGLTARESEVLALLVEGLTNGEIARRLGIAERTVSKHLEHMFPKLGVQSRAAAVAQALRSRAQSRSATGRPA